MLDRSDLQILVVPPWENAGDDHWMSHWQRKYPLIQRVEQDDWNHPELSEWLEMLDAAVTRQTKPVVLVAHSLGAVTAVRWAANGGKIAAAFFVAPPDLDQANTPAEIAGFGPMPAAKLGFPSMLVASENDPYVSIERARFFADAWGSEFVNIGQAGHINPRSGHGIWAEGESLLSGLITKCFVAEAAIGGAGK